MVKKKLNPVKDTKKGGEATSLEDVKIHTGLPPKVDGQVRCFCKVGINQVLWAATSPLTTTVLVRWWGEEGGGALFRPYDVRRGNKSTALVKGRYPVRSGPRQFAAYLKDMGSLDLAVFTSADTSSEPVGHCRITEIGLLSNNRPINGFFPIILPQDERVGELQVSIMLEPMMASSDDLGCIPTTDVNMDPRHSQESMLPSATRPRPHSQQPVKPQEDLFVSPASLHTEDPRLQNGARIQNAADLKLRLNYGLGDGGHNHSYTDVAVNRGEAVRVPFSPQRMPGPGEAQQQSGEGDLLSVLLSRGTELRQAMVVSSLNSQDKEQNNSSLGALPSAGPLGGAGGGVVATYSPVPGVMVDNLLGDQGPTPVDMLLGSPVAKHEWQMLRMQMQNGCSPGPSMCSEVVDGLDMVSDPEDPMHDRTLLQELFYKRSDSELSGLSGDEVASKQPSLQDPGNARPPSRCSSISSMAAALPASDGTPTKKRKRKLKNNGASSSDAPKSARSRSRSRSRSADRSCSKERNPRMTKTVTAGPKPKSRSRSGSRSKSGSRSRSKTRKTLSQKRKSSLSDSDSGTPRSEISRVSFDPAPSDVEDDMDPDPTEKRVDGLSVERLTLLGRVHLARVNILTLNLHGHDLDTSSGSKTSSRFARNAGKPPRPSKNRKPCTYLIEYQFPVVATSRDKYSPNAMATEVMRVASKTVNNGVVSFSHRSVFPLMFDGAALEKWWKSALVFKVYAREAGQKAPVLLGSCGVPLKSILKSDDLHLTRDLEIRELGRNSSQYNSARNASLNSSRSASGAPLLGALKVSVELASDHKDFATSLARTRVAEMSNGGQNVVPVVPPSPPPVPSLHLPSSPSRLPAKAHQSAKHTSLESFPAAYLSKQQSLPGKSHSSSAPSFPSSTGQELAPLQKPVFQTSTVSHQSSQSEPVTLHTLIMVPEGCNISLHGVPPLHMVSKNPSLVQQQLAHHAQTAGRDQMTRNTYLVCRMFWTNDSVHSNVCWGALNPQYGFNQVAPVLVTPSLLERMRNNYMVIEVWDKKTSAESDSLIGITKLSLHQFYMSFRDSKIAGALLRSEYPVVSIDNYMPVVDPFTGLHYGQLSVLLAMGSAEQVACLQRLKADKETLTNPGPQRPNHFLERQDVYSHNQGDVRLDSSGTSVDHMFEIVVQGVRGLKLLETMIWGEADCFVQYFFPAQQGQSQNHGPTIAFATPTLRSFRTATTLCIPDPTFHDVNRHRFTLAVGIPLQRELLTACANSSGGSGGLPFEVWCRFYHPNVRDQVIARTTLPLAKLCAMVTMQKRGEVSVQSFSLPLSPVASDDSGTECPAKMKDSGLLDVTVHYKTQMNESSVGASMNQPVSGSQVCLSVAVIRASGLKAAAETAAQADPAMQYPAEVGVNSYIRLRLSFLGKQEDRVTKTVARSFSPEFSHHVEFPLQLLWSGSHDDPGSLAQMLETGQAEFEVWHQVPGMIPGVTEYEVEETTGGKRLVQTSEDVLLGTCIVPLHQLLTRHAGIKGWFAVDRPTSTWPGSGTAAAEDSPAWRMVGGLELSVHFAHSSDRQRVVEAGRTVGWAPVESGAMELDEWQEEETGQRQHHQVTVSVDKVSVPLSRVLLPGQTALDPAARCYIRYRFFDREAVISRTSRLKGDGERLQAVLQHRHTMVLPHSAPFQWYLKEERLELQIWVTFRSRDKGQRPLQRDKLIGTAFVDLLPIADSRRHQHRISGLLPLFKPGAATLSGASVQLHLTSNLCQGSQLLDDLDGITENGQLPSDMDEDDYDSADSFHQLVGPGSVAGSPVKKKKGRTELEGDSGAGFTVHLAVERALHLPTVRAAGSSVEVSPTTYISYQSSNRNSSIYSDIVPNSVDPVWDYSAEVRLSQDLLTLDNKNLVLKVWHKPEGARKQPDKSCDRVLGFVSVDLCPLNSGLQQICGWYNIVDFNGQSRGQIKVSITPVDLVATGNSNTATSRGPSVSMLSSGGRSVCIQSEPVAGFNFFPSLPTFSGQLSSGREERGGPVSLPGNAAPAPHWQPRFTMPSAGSAVDSSKSMLFSSLRQQLRDLDGMTQRLRLRLSCEDSSDIDANQPASARSADILTGTHSGLSTIHTTSSLAVSREVLSDVSHQLLASTRDMITTLTASVTTTNNNSSTSYHRHQQQNGSLSLSEDNTSHNAVDSGAFSGNNTGKSADPPDSQRSEGPQVTFGAAAGSSSKTQAGKPPSGTLSEEVSSPTAEVQFLTESPQGALTPRDFSSNSQTSQGFQPTGGAVGLPSDSSTSGSARVRGQKVPVLANLVSEEDEDRPRPPLPHSSFDVGSERLGTSGKQAKMSIEEEYLNPTGYHGNDNSEEDEEDDEMFGSYHHYRAMLDRQEEENLQDNQEEDVDNEETTITPRRINDVSGMLRQFDHQHGTLPPVFPPQGLYPGGDASALAQTWPNHLSRSQQDSDRSGYKGGQEAQENREEESEGKEEEEVGQEEVERLLSIHSVQTEEDIMARDRNSFIDSWLEESAEHDTLRSQPLPLRSSEQWGSVTVTTATTTTHLQQLDQELELDLPSSGDEEEREEDGGEEGEATPRAEEDRPSESALPPSGLHLLSNIELIDTLTSVQNGARRKRNGQKKQQPAYVGGMLNRHGDRSREGRGNIEDTNTCSDPSAFLHLNGHSHDPRLLSNVELYSTMASSSTLQTTVSRPPAPRHLLSNVELASSASGSSHHPDTASSRPSRQSSANSRGHRPELEACTEVETSQEDKTHEFVENDGVAGGGAVASTDQPLSARSEEISEMFSRTGQRVVNGACDSSDEEELQFQNSAAARAVGVKARASAKSREPCQSTTGMTEDSGLESGAKSSQDEREALSLLDSTQGHGHSHHHHHHHQPSNTSGEPDLSSQMEAGVPEFFLPMDELQASMRALQLATSAATHTQQQHTQTTRQEAKAQASAGLTRKLQKATRFNGAVSAKGRQRPTAEEAKRIAKIFSAKPS